MLLGRTIENPHFAYSSKSPKSEFMHSFSKHLNQIVHVQKRPPTIADVKYSLATLIDLDGTCNTDEAKKNEKKI